MFQSYVKDLVKRYKEVEKIRKQLIKRYDFNLIDAFFICKGRKEYLGKEDFKLAINIFDVFPTEQELYLLFIRYANRNRIKYLIFYIAIQSLLIYSYPSRRVSLI
jgi:hypothetical protein